MDVFLAALILGLLGLIVARLDRVDTKTLTGALLVNDGDSITLGDERIRLRGIDAPELNQTCRRNGATYPCGRDAKSALRDLIAGRPVTCAGWERDRYGRLLGSCRADATDLNRSLVTEGWAIAFGDFEAEERSARQASRGLWAGDFEPPRQWRDTHGSLAEPVHDLPAAIINWLRAMFGLG